MSATLIEEQLTGDSTQVRDLINNEAVLVGFLTLVKQIDDLPEMDIRFYEDSRSLYQATASGQSLDELAAVMSEFFGSPAKAAGKNLSVSLRFEPTVKYLGGVRKDQVLFLKKLKTGSFYGALWPWQRDKDRIEVHLGFCSPGMSDADEKQLETMIGKFLCKKKIETISDVGGEIHGISLPSFLQMSEMEGATYTLKVTSGDRSGRLFLDGGTLIAAQYESLTGNAAAYRIISWDKASIQIEAADPDRVREIHDPLMHVMMESLKIKDEAGAEPPPAAPAAPLKKKTSPRRAPVPAPAQAPATPAIDRPSAIRASMAASPLPTAERPAGSAAGAASQNETVPFTKATDRSMGKQAQMSRTNKLLILLGLVIVFAVVVTFGGKLIQQRQLNRRYDQLMADLAVTKELDAQIVLLMQYLKDNPKDRHRGELELRLNEANAEIEKGDFEKTILDVNQLPLDEKYEQKALSLYTAFLTKHPQSPYAAQINEAIGGIRQLLGTAYFEDLKKMSGSDVMERYTAYRAYLDQFPEGTERRSVERMISTLADSYASSIHEQSALCDSQKNWDVCIAQCDRFLSIFSDQSAAQSVHATRAKLNDKKELFDLIDEAARMGSDFAKARAVYTDYLAQHPQTTQKDAILDRIAILAADHERLVAWQRMAAFAKDPAQDVFERVHRLDAYLQNNASGQLSERAKQLRAGLEPELQRAIRERQLSEARRRELARQQAEQERLEKAAQRIARLQLQVNDQLRPVSGRFVSHGDGTFTDKMTGLTWCLLDSYLELGRCLDFRQARAYIDQLNTGGHTDWRLPNAGELATLYKNKPFFPSSQVQWYWSSEFFARGYHRVVDVVTTEPETVFKRIPKEENNCGGVRAVRR